MGWGGEGDWKIIRIWVRKEEGRILGNGLWWGLRLVGCKSGKGKNV